MKTLLFIVFLITLALSGCSNSDNPVSGDTPKSSIYTVDYVVNNRDYYSVQCDNFHLQDLKWIIGNDTIESELITYIKPKVNQ